MSSTSQTSPSPLGSTGLAESRSSDTGSDESGGSKTDEARSQAENVAETGKEKAAEVGREARTQASRLLHDAGSQARDQADSQVGQAAGFLSQVSDELDQMAGGVDASNSHLQGFARDGADAARRLSERLESGGLDGAIDDVRQFARRRPVVFLAGGFAVGLALGRLTRNADLGQIANAGAGADDQRGDQQQPLRSPTDRPTGDDRGVSTPSGSSGAASSASRDPQDGSLPDPAASDPMTSDPVSSTSHEAAQR